MVVSKSEKDFYCEIEKTMKKEHSQQTGRLVVFFSVSLGVCSRSYFFFLLEEVAVSSLSFLLLFLAAFLFLLNLCIFVFSTHNAHIFTLQANKKHNIL